MWKLAVAVVLAAGLAGCGDGAENKQASVNRNSEASTSVPAASQPVAVVDDGPVITGREAGAALSDYIGQLNVALMTNAAMQQVQLSKVQQSIQFQDLDKYTEAAEQMKASAMQAREDIQRIQTSANLNDQDAELFNSVGEAVDGVMSVSVDLAVDIAAEAHTGMNMLDGKELRQLASDTKEAHNNLKAVVKKAYVHFGYKPSEIDWDTLMIKGRVPKAS